MDYSNVLILLAVLVCLHLVKVVCDVSLIYGKLKEFPDKHYVQCIADAHDPGIYISATDSRDIRRKSEYENTIILEDFETPSEEKWKGWEWTNNTILKEPVTDKRWEAFPGVESLTHTETSIIRISALMAPGKILSVNETEICESNSTESKVYFQTDTIDPTQTYLVKVRQHCQKTTVFSPPSTWIIEEYGFVVTRDPQNKIVLKNISYNGLSCLSIYMSACESCKLNVTIFDEENEEVFNTTEILPAEKYKWKDIEICYGILPATFTIVLVSSSDRIINRTLANEFWALDDIRLSTQKDQRTLSHLFDDLAEFHGCQSMDASDEGILIITDNQTKDYQYEQECGRNFEKYCNQSFSVCTICCLINGTSICYPIILLEESDKDQPQPAEPSSWSLSYLYFLLLLIPGVAGLALGLYFCFRKQNLNERDTQPHEDDPLKSPSWLFKEPEYSDEDNKSRRTEDSVSAVYID